MPDETWKPVPESRLLGIPAGYQASSRARILGLSGTVLAQQEDKDGYNTVKLGRKRFRVAVLVQLAFAGPPEVRHMDDNRKNDRPENLRWGSRWENERDKKEETVGTGEVFVTVPSLPVTAVTPGGQVVL